MNIPKDVRKWIEMSKSLRRNWVIAEVWMDVRICPPYILLLLNGEGDNTAIYDPKENYNTLYEFKTYAEAKAWIENEGFTLVEGRVNSSSERVEQWQAGLREKMLPDPQVLRRKAS